MLRSFHIENFMSIAEGSIDFGSGNIINIKGYNDSGKSAILRAMDVLFFNIRPNAQVNFIKDGADHFRLTAVFTDGVVIIRDKYINGQSLYEMYKGDDLICTTKKDGILTKVTGVPEIIEKYLGLLECDGALLNSRTCFEKQFLVQTSGSDNYKMLNTVLRSEEIATAGTLLNNDKNKVGSDIAQLDSQIQAYSELLRGTDGLTSDIVSSMEQLDTDLTVIEGQVSELQELKSAYTEVAGVEFVGSEVPVIVASEVEVLHDIYDVHNQLSKIGTVSDELPLVEATELGVFQEIYNTMNALKSISSGVLGIEIPDVVWSEVSAIMEVKAMFADYLGAVSAVSTLDAEINALGKQMDEVQTEADEQGIKFVKCRNCGTLNAVSA